MKKQITGGIVVFLFVLTLGFGPFGSVGVFQNSWSTNRPPTAVQGVDNLSVSNLPQSKVWAFFGSTSNTVARLHDISQSNGAYVLRLNGQSDGQTATNLTVEESFVANGLFTVDSEDGAYLNFSSLGLYIDADNSLGAESSIYINGDQVIGVDTNASLLSLGPSSGFTSIQIGNSTPFVWAESVGGYPISLGMTLGRPQNTWSNIYGRSFYGTNFHPQMATASKLAALDGQTNITNSVYSDADIANALAGLSSTNIYIKTNGGVGYFTQLYSATNAPLVSNQVAETIQGLVGQNTNVFVVNPTGGVVTAGSPVVISGGGRVGIGTNVPAQALDVIGSVQASGNGIFTGYVSATNGLVTTNVGGHSWRTENFGNGFTYNIDFDGVTLASLNNAANWNVTSITIAGSTLSDSSRNVKTTTITNSGSSMFTGPVTNRSIVSLPTNAAPANTIVSGGLHVLTLGKGWTNDLGGRADLEIYFKLTDAATGDPSFAFTNTTSGVSWTNGIAFGVIATDSRTVTVPDINPNDTGSLTDLSGAGATVTIIQAWWHVK